MLVGWTVLLLSSFLDRIGSDVQGARSENLHLVHFRHDHQHVIRVDELLWSPLARAARM